MADTKPPDVIHLRLFTPEGGQGRWLQTEYPGPGSEPYVPETKLQAAQAERDDARAEVARLREVLGRVEWIDARWKAHWIECPLCHKAQPHSTPVPEHEQGCALHAAIAAKGDADGK